MADKQLTLFDLPSSPDAFGVELPPAQLRRIDFSGLDFDTCRRAAVEYIKTYYPDEFNDFVSSNGIIMLIEAFSAMVAKAALRGDILALEQFLPTARTEVAVRNHLKLINQDIRRQTPAVTDIELTLTNVTTTDVLITPGLKFSTPGPDNRPVIYEIFRAPGDFTSELLIPAGKRGIIAWGIEGEFAAPTTVSSPGGPNQIYAIDADNVLSAPLSCVVSTGDIDEDWKVVYDPLERYTSSDKVVEARIYSNRLEFRFGDDVNGRAPLAGQVISFRYRVGGGSRGRIGAGIINESRSVTPLPPANAPVEVRFRNITPSSGGVNAETLEEAKKRAPRDFAVANSIVTDSDYAQVASTFSHPVFGAVSKALATIRTSLNANLVEVYVLADGPDGQLVTPSVGLKKGLKTFFEELNVLTDDVVILDGAIHPVDTDATIIINRNADATVVKERVESAISEFFDINNWQMGQPFYISDFITTIRSIDGVAYVDVFEPADNILATGALSSTDDNGIGLNEVIVEGIRKIQYFYERSRGQR